MNRIGIRLGLPFLLLFAAGLGFRPGAEAGSYPGHPSVYETASVFREDGMIPLPYRQAVIGSELPGRFALIVFFHGVGERGKDNQKQVTLAYAPLLRYCVANGVWDLLSRCPDLVAGAIVVSGGGDVNQAESLKRIPNQVVHGTQDVIVPVARSRSMVKAIWNAGGDRVVYREMPRAGHEVWDAVFDDPATWEWLFAQQADALARGGPSRGW